MFCTLEDVYTFNPHRNPYDEDSTPTLEQAERNVSVANENLAAELASRQVPVGTPSFTSVEFPELWVILRNLAALAAAIACEIGSLAGSRVPDQVDHVDTLQQEYETQWEKLFVKGGLSRYTAAISPRATAASLDDPSETILGDIRGEAYR